VDFGMHLLFERAATEAAAEGPLGVAASLDDADHWKKMAASLA
jgi:hypothetical protein